MSHKTSFSEFSETVTETAMKAAKTIARNLATSSSLTNNGDIVTSEHMKTGEDLKVSEESSEGVTNILTHVGTDSIVTNAARKLVTTTSSTLSSISATFQHHQNSLSTEQSSHSSNVFLSTNIPTSTTPSNYDIVDGASKSFPGNDPTATAHANIMNDDVNENTAAHLSMQSHIQNLDSPKSIKYLIERLQQKLSDVQGSSPEDLHSLSLPNPHSSSSGGFPSHQDAQDSLPSSSVTNYVVEKVELNRDSENKLNSTSDILSNTTHIHTQFTDYENNNSDNVILHSDTIILVSSMVCMIIMGLALYKLFEYLTKRNRRKIMARHGLKQIGEHMHVVTRTMSAFTEQEPSGNAPTSTPKPVRKRPLVDSPSTARVLREVRRGTVFKPPTYIMRRDDDMDFGLAFQTASQAAHNKKMQFEEGVEMHIQQNDFTDGVGKHERKH